MLLKLCVCYFHKISPLLYVCDNITFFVLIVKTISFALLCIYIYIYCHTYIWKAEVTVKSKADLWTSEAQFS